MTQTPHRIYAPFAFPGFLKFGIRKFFLLASFFGFVACSKHQVETPHPPPDKISSHPLNPAIILRSIRTYSAFVSSNPFCNNRSVPNPFDSTVSCLIDIDGDSINDFQVEALHGVYTPFSYCGHCNLLFSYAVKISPLSASDSLCAPPMGPGILSLNDVINSDRKFQNTVLTLRASNDCLGILLSFPDSYVGIRHKSKFGWIHVVPLDKNGIMIDKFAFNATPGNSIKAGQEN